MTDQAKPTEVAANHALPLLEKKAAALRHELVELRRKLSHARRALSESHAIQLQEANQELVLAALHADDIAAMAIADLATLTAAFQCDVVTGTLNRAFMLDRLERALLMARRDGRCLALVFIDLDHFKPINDRLGHAVGDEVLQIVARSLQSVLRESDSVCRYGGDEFLVLLPAIAAPADAERIAADMLMALGTPVSVGGEILRLSASLGISIYPDDGEDPTTLINHADAAMYRRKHAGLGDFQPHQGAWFQEQSPSLQDLREANAQLVLAALKAQESAADATEAHRQQLKHMAIVAHELRNPLTPLRIAAGLLINRSSTGEIPVERLQVIINGQVTCMTRLIDDLLDASRLSTSTLRIERSDVDLGSILNQVAASHGPGMELRQQRFSMCIRPEPIRMFGDPIRLAQIFSNLLDNACKYTPEKGEIALELVLLDTCVVITVRDNGIGISSGALPTIFDLFVQDAGALPHSDGGLGIGLSVVRDLVQAHGGNVVAHSAGRGCGSDFVVTLPLSGC